MKLPNNTRQFRGIIFSIFAAVLFLHCSHGPPPTELKELNDILAAKGASGVKEAPGGSKLYRDTRRYRRKARILYENGQRERARHFAILGRLRYRTAEALMRQYRAKKRFEATTSKLNTERDELREYKSRIAELENEIEDINEAISAGESNELARRLTQLPDNPSESVLETHLIRAGKVRKEALSVKANEYAEAHFNRADNYLKSAKNLAENDGEVASALRSAVQASHFFREAERQARPEYEEYIRKMQPPQRIEQIQKTAANTFGAEYMRKRDRGVRVILAGLFPPGESDFRPKSKRLVDALATIADDFSEFEVDVHGYAHSGNNQTQRLELSRARAESVKDYLIDKKVKEGRIATYGESGSMTRFDDSPERNERVEVSLRISSETGSEGR